jgi:hypothetical protein
MPTAPSLQLCRARKQKADETTILITKLTTSDFPLDTRSEKISVGPQKNRIKS